MALPHLLRYQIPFDRKHFGADICRETVHLSAVLLHLLRIQHALQTARLWGKFEQSLPLVFGQCRLLGRRPRRILCLALGLPRRNLGLLSCELSLVILVVVQICVVRLDAVQEQVACLLKERVDGEIQSVQGWVGRNLDGSTLDVR